MKIAIVYASVHHGNTKKLVDAIADAYGTELIDATKIKEKNLSEYDAIGFASGIYYGKFHQAVLNFASVNLPQEKTVFLICTHGGNAAFGSIEAILKNKRCSITDRFSCKGYDTFGPFRLIGGIAKGHPDDKDIKSVLDFYDGIIKKMQV